MQIIPRHPQHSIWTRLHFIHIPHQVPLVEAVPLRAFQFRRWRMQLQRRLRLPPARVRCANSAPCTALHLRPTTCCPWRRAVRVSSRDPPPTNANRRPSTSTCRWRRRSRTSAPPPTRPGSSFVDIFTWNSFNFVVQVPPGGLVPECWFICVHPACGSEIPNETDAFEWERDAIGPFPFPVRRGGMRPRPRGGGGVGRFRRFPSEGVVVGQVDTFDRPLCPRFALWVGGVGGGLSTFDKSWSWIN